MLQSIVGPPIMGVTDLKPSAEKTAERGFKSSREETSFGRTLEGKMTSKSSPDQKDLKRPQEDVNGVAPPKREQSVSKSTNKKATVRQQAIKEFMDSFESEFKISPTRLVEAMAQLDDTELSQTPDITADAVVAQLGLDETETEAAAAMYAGLLMQLSQLPPPNQERTVPSFTTGTGMTPQHMQVRVAAAQSKQDVMASSVDSLSKKFWANPDAKSTSTLMQNLEIEEQSSAAAPEELSALVAEGASEASEMKSALESLPPHLKGQMSEVISPSLLAALAAKQAATSAEGQEAEGMEEGPALLKDFKQAMQAPKPSVENSMSLHGVEGQSSSEFFRGNSQEQSLMQQQAQNFGDSDSFTQKESGGKIVDSSGDFKKSLTGLEGLHGAPIKSESLALEMAPQSAPPPGMGASRTTNDEAAIKQVMSQAQYLIKKGGGEMKVQMTPEGMGTIHLKVMLQDGKVNLQMSADTQEAKKTIESSLAELKTSLAAQKLSMENVKVDVVNTTSTDTAAQNQTNMNGQNQRDQARQFWNQFNDNFGSQGRRESFMEMPNLKGYGQRERNPLQPIETSSKVRPRTLEGKGSGLNLVA